MAFGGFDNKGAGSHTVSEINMVPLIDVMLVLLVIFIITAPLLAHSIRIDLPRVSAEQLQADPKAIDLAIKADGSLFWNDQPVTMDELADRLAASSQDKPQPEIHIRDLTAQKTTRYRPGDELLGGTIVMVDYRPLPKPDQPLLQSYSRLILKIDKEYWAVERGKTLADKRKLTTSELPSQLARQP